MTPAVRHQTTDSTYYERGLTVNELIEVLSALPANIREYTVYRVGTRDCVCCGPSVDAIHVHTEASHDEPRVVLE